MSHHRGLETLAVAGHGSCVAIHGLAAVWHRVTAGRWDIWAKLHGGIAIVSAVSVGVHAWRISHESSQELGLELTMDSPTRNRQ